jgi:hypothetical protein
MRKLYILVALLLVSAMSFGQAPSGMSYQGVVRDSGGALVVSQAVGMQISILLGSSQGNAVYRETQLAITNANGLVSLEIGTGSTTDDFSAIDWSSGSYFIKTETDPTGGNNYSIVGTSQLMSMPYALYAKTSGSSIAGAAGTNGIDGAIGAAGPQGATGTSGADGTNGATGAQGIQGLIGLTGAAGTNGLAGIDGATGISGTNGADGATGAAGAASTVAGPTGPQGPTGAASTVAGPTGPQGLAGAASTVAGPTGPQGLAGAASTVAGPQGPQGLAGAASTVAGTQGPAGNDGADGATGPQGLTGEAGQGGLIRAADGIVVTGSGTVADPYIVSTKTYTIGLVPELGGYVFWLTPDGKHGLVAETQDQGTGSWYQSHYMVSAGGHSTNGQKFIDWRVPNLHVLWLMYSMRSEIGGFNFLVDYWSSTESDSTNAYSVNAKNGGGYYYNKERSYNVRAVRTF